MKEIAERFRNLPFAFLQEPEIENLALEIEAGNYHKAIETLSADIECHQHADNWIKADHEKKFVLSLIEQSYLQKVGKSKE